MDDERERSRGVAMIVGGIAVATSEKLSGFTVRLMMGSYRKNNNEQPNTLNKMQSIRREKRGKYKKLVVRDFTRTDLPSRKV